MRLRDLIFDPPPSLVFEFSEEAVVGVRRRPGSHEIEMRAERPLGPGALEASVARPNFVDPEQVREALDGVAADLGPVRPPHAALLLPDGAARLTVLDFDSLPKDERERLALLKFRLAKTAPFDVEAARVGWQPQRIGGRYAAIAALTPVEVVRQYESAVERHGLWPGYVAPSAMAALRLAPAAGMTLVAKLSGRTLTLAAVDGGVVRMVRTVETMSSRSQDHDRMLADLVADLYPTLIFVADNLNAPVSRLAVAGFESLLEPALERLPQELGVPVEALERPGGVAQARDSGIWGYLCRN